MIDKELIKSVVEEQLAQSDMFLVEIVLSAGSGIEIIVDGDKGVGIDACVELSKAVEGSLDRDAEDFELTVMSAGVGQPLRLLRQYLKIVGREVEIVFCDGSKVVATLMGADEDSVTVEYTEKVAVEGKKRKESVVRNRRIPLSEIKTTREHISFK